MWAERKVGKAKSLPGQEWVAAVSACRGGRDLLTATCAAHRVRAAHRPVTSGGKLRVDGMQRPERVLPASAALAGQRDRQHIHLGLVGGPQRLNVCGGRKSGEPGYVMRVHYLKVSQVMPETTAIGRPGRLDGVKGVADRTIAEGVEMAGNRHGPTR